MKICLLALSQRRSCSFINSDKFSDYSKYEYLDMARLLHLGGAEVYSIDKRLDKDIKLDFVNELEIMEPTLTDLNQFDCVVFINSNLTNIFGGYKSLKEDFFKKIDLVNNFKGPKFYLFRDVNYLLTTDKGNKLNIDSDNLFYISQSKNKDLIMEDIDKKSELKLKTFVPKEILWYPLEQISIINKDYLNGLNKNKLIKTNYIPKYNDSPEFDLVYAGGFRKARISSIKDYIAETSSEFNNLIIGPKDKYEAVFKEYNNLFFQDQCKYELLRNKLNQGIASVALGDKLNVSYNCPTQRIYESIDAKLVSFIDLKVDPDKRVIDTPELQEFLYVSNITELSDKLNKLKKDDKFRKHIVELELKDPKYDIDKKKYCEDFVKLIASKV